MDMLKADKVAGVIYRTSPIPFFKARSYYAHPPAMIWNGLKMS